MRGSPLAWHLGHPLCLRGTRLASRSDRETSKQALRVQVSTTLFPCSRNAGQRERRCKPLRTEVPAQDRGTSRLRYQTQTVGCRNHWASAIRLGATKSQRIWRQSSKRACVLALRTESSNY